MTQLEFEWGDWIAPDQISLFDENQLVKVRWNDGATVTNDGLRKCNFVRQNWVDGSVDAFAVPADHAYYLATSAGLAYWPGFHSRPPVDWDGRTVLLRDGHKIEALSALLSWVHQPGGRDIIGYRKAQPVMPAAGEEPAFWALNRASEEIGNLVTPATALTALARYIERHETAPVDPDVLAVREILAAYAGPWGAAEEAAQIRAGLNDDGPAFQAALGMFRTIKANGGVPDVPSA